MKRMDSLDRLALRIAFYFVTLPLLILGTIIKILHDASRSLKRR